MVIIHIKVDNDAALCALQDRLQFAVNDVEFQYDINVSIDYINNDDNKEET